MTRTEAAEFYSRLEDFERETRQPGRQDGAVTRNGLAVVRALLWTFMNWQTGRLDPGYAAIARQACISIRSVARGIQALRRAGVLHWIRRCQEDKDDEGRFCLVQITNLYGFRSVAQWIGFKKPADDAQQPEPSPPDAIALGLTQPIERGTVEAGTFDRDYELIVLEGLASSGDKLAAVLARGLRDRMAKKDQLSEMPPTPRNPTVITNPL